MRFYPKGALRKGVTGRTTLQCRVATTGAMTGCDVLNESPTGFGFGDAALAMTPLFRVNQAQIPCPLDGCAIVRIPIVFAIAR